MHPCKAFTHTHNFASMISFISATEKDASTIVNIGKLSVKEAHLGSCPEEILDAYLSKHYNTDAIKKELADPTNIYSIITYNGQPAGFSKIIFNSPHAAINRTNTTKLDRIYLLKEFQGAKLGYELLQYNIALAKSHTQSGIWLFTWMGNKKAIDFYTKAGFTTIGNHNFHVAENYYNANYHMLLNFV
jgi:diamine N-acetyltransferase